MHNGERANTIAMTFPQTVRDAVHRLTIPMRCRYYCGSGNPSVVPRLPTVVRRKLGLNDRSAVGSRKIEIGGGTFPQQGYIHVDVDRRARHLEVFTPAWNLPFPDRWATEVLAIHSLEHVHPRMLLPTLREWHRVLAPDGRVRIHVPNTEELVSSFLHSPVAGKWRTMGAVLGMYCHPGVSAPEDLEVPSDHQMMFDWELISWSLASTGFHDIVNLTTEVRDKHTEDWCEVVPHFSLIAEAVKKD